MADGALNFQAGPVTSNRAEMLRAIREAHAPGASRALTAGIDPDSSLGVSRETTIALIAAQSFQDPGPGVRLHTQPALKLMT